MIFVDELRSYPEFAIKREARPYGRLWAHLWCDGDEEELHEFAKNLGLKREWFQGNYRNPMLRHYDLTQSKRLMAIRNGAIFKSLHDHAGEIAAAIRAGKDLDDGGETTGADCSGD